MKTLIATLLVVASCSAMADVSVTNDFLGSGTPGVDGTTRAYALPDGVYFAPQYMPGYPTAAVIWPRYVEVQCDTKGADRVCDGYRWSPKMGRGEYLMIVPVARTAPVVVTNTVEKVVLVPTPVPVAPAEKKISE